MIGHGELVVIVLVILVLFGAAAIPKFARSLGLAKKEFTKAMKETEDEEKKSSVLPPEFPNEEKGGNKA